MSEIAPHLEIFTATFGLSPHQSSSLQASQTGALFGAAQACELRALQTPGVDSGVVLCRFATPSEQPLRSGEARLHLDAFRVIDFYAPDFNAALEHAEATGFAMATSKADYELAEGAFREAHHVAGDEVVTALLGGPEDFFTEFAEVRDRVVSEPVSISLPLTDAAPTIDFYATLFGWEIVYEYDFEAASFSELLGTEERLTVRSSTVGPSRQQTYVNLVDYGLPQGTAGSLGGLSVAPARGILGLVILSDELDAVVAKAHAAQIPVSETVEIELAPYGRCRAVVAAAPFGAPHLILERA